MPEMNGTLDADDFRMEGADPDGNDTIQDPFTSPAPTQTVPPTENLRDLVARDNAQSNSAQEQDADTGADRYRHMQSRADKATRLAEDQAKKIADLEAQLRMTKPVLDLLEGDEEIGRMIDARLANQQGPQMPQRPQEPQPPDSFNEAESFTNPQSDSYRFRKAREKFLIDNQKYLEQMMGLTLQQQAQREQALARQQYEQRKLLETHQRLVRDFQFTPVEAQDFMQTMTSNDSVSFDNLVRYYRFLRSQPTRGNAVPPPATGGNPRGQSLTPDEMFNQHLFEIGGKPKRR